MRINISTTKYAEWTPGARTINIYEYDSFSTQSDTRYIGWANTDCISFGYDLRDNSTTQIHAVAVLLRHLIDDAMDRHPAGRDTVSHDDPDLIGNCDICGNPYDIGSRFDHCGDCGCCHLCCYCTDRCPACGDLPDYCQGHGWIGDPVGHDILARHDLGNHSLCHYSSPCWNQS